MADPIVLAFSGGLDTSFCIPWLGEQYGCPVITVTVDSGGLSGGDRAMLEGRALGLGAVRHHVVDARQDYFQETLSHLLTGNVLRGHLYPLCVGAERALQARVVAQIARQEGAKAVAHGSTAAGNDQVRFEVALMTLLPGVEILAPIRDQGFSREDEAAYLAKRGVEWPENRSAYSINSGLWGCTIGGRETSDTVDPLPEDAWLLTRGAFDHPRPPESHILSFQKGEPAALDRTPMGPVDLIEGLNTLAGGFGIGRGIHLGDTILGLKGRVGFEAPAATVLIQAHRELEKLTLTARQQRVKDHVAMAYGDFIHEGLFYDPACRDIEALLVRSQERVTGEVRLLFRPGSAMVEGVSSPYSLKAASVSVYGETAKEWTAEDARGFSRIFGLQGMLFSRAGKKGHSVLGGDPNE